MSELLFFGGIYNFSFVLFHLLFWKLFNWNMKSNTINSINLKILQILNLCLIFVFIIFAYISVFHTEEMLNSVHNFSIYINHYQRNQNENNRHKSIPI